jgi:hypothetical protein
LWQTPKATNADCPVIHNPQRSDGGQPNLAAQMVLEQQRQWMTPRACEAQNPPMGVDKRHHGLTHQVTKTWATPRANERDGTRTPNGNPKKDGIPPGMQAKQWATPAARDTQGQRGAAANARKGNPLDTLPNQMAQWGTPTARDHKSGRGNEDRQYKELTPMVERQQSGKLNPRWVETLMGLPIGWTMPSCTSPQTIAPMSCDSSAMASCLPPQSELSEFSLASWPSPRLNENQQTEELGLLWAENGFKQPKTRGGKARANGSTFDVTLETAARGVAAMEATT